MLITNLPPPCKLPTTTTIIIMRVRGRKHSHSTIYFSRTIYCKSSGINCWPSIKNSSLDIGFRLPISTTFIVPFFFCDSSMFGRWMCVCVGWLIDCCCVIRILKSHYSSHTPTHPPFYLSFDDSAQGIIQRYRTGVTEYKMEDVLPPYFTYIYILTCGSVYVFVINTCQWMILIESIYVNNADKHHLIVNLTSSSSFHHQLLKNYL